MKVTCRVRHQVVFFILVFSISLLLLFFLLDLAEEISQKRGFQRQLQGSFTYFWK